MIEIKCDICKLPCASDDIANAKFQVESALYPNLIALSDICHQCLEVLEEFVKQRIKAKDKIYGRE